jgi:hypothetical protein
MMRRRNCRSHRCNDRIASAGAMPTVKSIGYMPTLEEEPWFHASSIEAIDPAWRREIRRRGDQITLAELLDACLREGILAIGEKFPNVRKLARFRAGEPRERL